MTDETPRSLPTIGSPAPAFTAVSTHGAKDWYFVKKNL